MNKIILILFFLLGFLCSSQETFLVLHLEGEITYDSIIKPIKVGDEFVGNPKFKFSSKSDRAALLSNLRGRIILFPNQNVDSKISEVSYYLKNNVLPVKEYTATRGQNDNFTILYFKENKLFLPKRIKAFTIPKNEESFYAIEYRVKGKTFQTNLKISNDGFLELDSNSFPLAQHEVKSKDVEKIFLKFYDHKSNRFFEINSLLFKHFLIENITLELSFYKKELKKRGLNKAKIKLELLEYLQDVYTSDLRQIDFDI